MVDPTPPPTPQGPEAPPAAPPAPATPEELAALRERAAKADEYLSLLQYGQAEYLNFRKRVAREKDEARALATRELLVRCLPVLDHLIAALAAPGGDGPRLREGVELTRLAFETALRDAGVEPIVTVGQPLDPERHEALGTVPRADVASGTVVEELTRGYTYQGRIVRPAKVRIAAPPAPPAPAAPPAAARK